VRLGLGVGAALVRPGRARRALRLAADVRVADIVYRLHLRPEQVDVATMHGRMQIDEFSAEYAWRDGVLTFLDADKQARYEVRPGARVAGGR
jgi:hypothetical protein